MRDLLRRLKRYPRNQWRADPAGGGNPHVALTYMIEEARANTCFPSAD